MIVYNRFTNEFEEFNNQQEYLTVLIDEERSDKAEIITFVSVCDEEFKLPLNSENHYDNIIAVTLFKKKDRNFAKHLDFFAYDNPDSLKKIINKL